MVDMVGAAALLLLPSKYLLFSSFAIDSIPSANVQFGADHLCVSLEQILLEQTLANSYVRRIQVQRPCPRSLYTGGLCVIPKGKR